MGSRILVQPSVSDFVSVVIFGTIVLLALAFFIILFLFLFRQKQLKNQVEKQAILDSHQRELLQSQLEIQNHTLQQIAEELHDNIGQLLTVAIMRLNALEDDVKAPAEKESVQQTRELIRTIIGDVRTLSKTLDFDTVQRFGLVPSLTLELERIQRVGRVQTHFTTAGEPYSLGEQTEIVLLRMAQESLNNALKHARARSLTVSATYQPTTFLLTIADDGRGFSVEEAMAQPLSQAGAGLSNLHRRAGLLGGTCTVVSQVGSGTRVEIRLARQHTV